MEYLIAVITPLVGYALGKWSYRYAYNRGYLHGYEDGHRRALRTLHDFPQAREWPPAPWPERGRR